MRKSLLIQTAILSLIIIIVFFSYRFFLYEEQNKEEKNLAKINQNITEKKDTISTIPPLPRRCYATDSILNDFQLGSASLF